MSKPEQTDCAKSFLTAQILIIFVFTYLLLSLRPDVVLSQATFISRLGSGYLVIKFGHQILPRLLIYGLIVSGVPNTVLDFGPLRRLAVKAERSRDFGQNEFFFTLICL
jgi:hypothetical protein